MYLEPGATLHPLLKRGLDLLSLAYKSGAAVQRSWRRLFRQDYPQLFVVSVDNLSFGGTGKTPFIIALGEELDRLGLSFAVICRGYRSRYERNGARVRAEHGPEDVGDEAVLLKNRFPAQIVLVGRDRHRSLRMAVACGCRVAIIDDGFQSADIAADVRVLLINPEQPFYYLRHFPSAMKRADRLLFYAAVPSAWLGRAHDYHFVLDGLFDSAGNRVQVGDSPVAVFSALADNVRFRRDLEHNLHIVTWRAFPDHHAFTSADLRELERLRQENGAVWLVCSEKDFVKVRSVAIGAIPFLHTRNRIQLHPDIIGNIVRHAERKGHSQA